MLRLGWKTVVLGALVVALAAGAVRAQGVDLSEPLVDGDDVQAAIDRMVAYLYGAMTPRGDWEEVASREGYKGQENAGKKFDEYGGRTALVTLALLYAGESPEDPRLAKAIKFLSEVELTGTYATGLRAGVWSKMYSDRVRPLLIRDAEWLMKGMTKKDGTLTGFYAYTEPCPGYGDHSNTQYGVLGLRDCAIRNLEIPLKYWEAVEKHMIDAQTANGGWGYGANVTHPPDNEAYGNMTVGGLANLYITLDRLMPKYTGPYNGKSTRGCGQHHPTEAIDKALEWLDRNAPVAFGHGGNGDPTPKFKGHGLGHYYLYGLERCGHASGRKTFGGINWFQEGARWMLNGLGDKDHFGSYRGSDIPTAWAILFLSKGQAPVFYNKLDTGPGWNNHVRDIPNLSEFIGDELEQRVNWQVVDLDAPVATWLDAPILYFSGHDLPDFTDEQKQKLRLYTDSGGTIVAEACCSKRAFMTKFQALARQVWPEWELEMVDRKHPVMTAHFQIRGRTNRMLHIDDGTRSIVFLLVQDISGAWNQDLRKKYLQHFQIGMNLARYASDKRMLRSRLKFYPTPVLKELAREGKPVPEPVADPVTVKVVDYPTDGRRLTAIRGLRHLDELLQQATAVHLDRRVADNGDLGDLSGVGVVRMSGLYSFNVPEKTLAALRAFVQRGGLILADAQMGNEAFDRSFVEFVQKLLPGAKLTDVLKTDPVITGAELPRQGFNLEKVRYRRVLRLKKFGVELKEVRSGGRRVVLYSPTDLTMGLDGVDAWGCAGLERNDALKLCANIVLSTLPAAGATP